jgi:hypothetical protein
MEEPDNNNQNIIINGRELKSLISFEYLCKLCKFKSRDFNDFNKINKSITCEKCKSSAVKIINVKNKYEDFTIVLDKIVEDLVEEFLKNEEQNLIDFNQPTNILKSRRVDIEKIAFALIYDQLYEYISTNDSFIIRYKNLQEEFRNKCKRSRPELILNVVKSLFLRKRDLLKIFVKLGIFHHGIKDIEFILFPEPKENKKDIFNQIPRNYFPEFSSHIYQNCRIDNPINRTYLNLWKNNKNMNNFEEILPMNKTCILKIHNPSNNEINNIFDDGEVLEEENNSIIEKEESIIEENNSIHEEIDLLKQDPNDDFLNEKISTLKKEKEVNLKEISNADNSNDDIKTKIMYNHERYVKQEYEKYSKTMEIHQKILKYLSTNKDLFDNEEYNYLLEAENRHFEVISN